MERMSGAFALSLLAGCSSQPDPKPAEVNVTIPVAMPQPAAEPDPVGWQSCETPSYQSIGNKWWGGFTACEGDVRVDLEVDSALMRGPDLRVSIRTRLCPAGKGAGGQTLNRAIFDRPFKAQLDEVKRIVRKSLATIGAECGGPAEALALLGPKFDAEFRDLARYWLRLSPDERRKAWASGEEDETRRGDR